MLFKFFESQVSSKAKLGKVNEKFLCVRSSVTDIPFLALYYSRPWCNLMPPSHFNGQSIPLNWC